MILRNFIAPILLFVALFPMQATIRFTETFVLQQGDRNMLQVQFSLENKVYEIKYNIDLGGKSIAIPKGCTLKFRGGRFVNGKITGQNTKIEARVKQIFDCDLELDGTWDVSEVYPEWFGALGDGQSDDTECIKRAIQFANKRKLVFANKTYIVNVTPGKDIETQRIVFFNCKCTEFSGCGTIIKLGNNDNCNLYAHKGFGALFSVYTIDTFVVNGITFDFNYHQNPILQTQGIRQGIQENTQQNAFQFRRVRKVVIENCKFIGHSGTNCIDYSDACYDEGDKIFEVTIRNCKFLKCGSRSFYKDNDTKHDAYHDSSTIAIHYRGNNHNTPFVVNILDNYFEGIGGNAYNVIETDGSEINFCGNTVEKFTSCIYPCSDIYDGKITIKNNHFRDVARGIKLWMCGGTNKDSDRYAYDTVDILNNECCINMGLWQNVPRYDNIGNIVSNRYGFVLTAASGNNKSVRNLFIRNNTIRYTNLKGVSPEICNKAVINFDNAGKSVLMMRCGRLQITDNMFFNPIFRVLHNSMFQEIDTLKFSGNNVYNPFSVTKQSDKSVIYLNHYKDYTPSLASPVIHNFSATRNHIIYQGFKSNDNNNMSVVNSTAVTSGLIKNVIID